MTTPNAATLETYETAAAAYLESTDHPVSARLKGWIDTVLEGMPQTARIVEIGSASGRDADYIESLGYRVERTDAVQAFVDHLVRKGHTARLFNAEYDALAQESCDLLYANAVFLHFQRHELTDVLKNLRRNLKEGGRLAFTLKEGRGEAWSSDKMGAPRYFCYWRADEIRTVLTNAGYNGEDIRVRDGWLCVSAARAARMKLPPGRKKNALARR